MSMARILRIMIDFVIAAEAAGAAAGDGGRVRAGDRFPLGEGL
jgi:hypothetical protein